MYLTARGLLKSLHLAELGGGVADSGEGRWTIAAAIDEAVPVHVLRSALFERFSSRGEADFANMLISAMGLDFGGHLEISEEGVEALHIPTQARSAYCVSPANWGVI